MLLKFLRKRKNMKRIMWGMAILIIPAFVIWGAGSSAKNKNSRPDYAGMVFGKKISYDYYYDMWNVSRDSAIKSFGNNVPLEFIDQMAWVRIILLEEAKRGKLAVTDKEVVDQLLSFPAFQRNGAFDKKYYKSVLQDNARAFEEKLRDDILLSKLRDSVTSRISVTDEEVKTEYKKKNEQIKSSYAMILFAESEKDALYKDSDLEDFYRQNKDTFRKNEQANVKYLIIPVSNAGAEELAYNVLDQVNAKKSLEEAAMLNSLEVKETGFFSAEDEVPDVGWSYDFTKASFELEKNQINNMFIKTEKGFYIIQLKEKKEPYIPDYADIKEKVKDGFIKEESIKLSQKKADKIYSEISASASGSKLEDLVRPYGLPPVKTTDFIARNGYIPEIGPAMDFVETAFSLKINDISKPLKTLPGWVILQPLEIKPIDEEKFAKEKDSFKETLLANKKEAEFSKYLQDLQKKAGFVSYTKK